MMSKEMEQEYIIHFFCNPFTLLVRIPFPIPFKIPSSSRIFSALLRKWVGNVGGEFGCE